MRGDPTAITNEPPAFTPTARDPLDAFFRPRCIAVIGASETPGSVGRTLLSNLLSQPFGGKVYPVNINRSEVFGIKASASVLHVPDKPDLAVVATPAATVPQVIRECVAARVPAAIIISAGFKETGPRGDELERQVLQEARHGGMRLIGPNCLGVMNPLTGLNATFAAGSALPGSVAFLSQSGALCAAILDWSRRELVGFSAFVSTGSMLDVGWGDLIDYLGNDPRTRSILIYMESVGEARSFLSAARQVAISKPIIVIKAGRTEPAARAATSHTGALAGSDEALDAAFRRVGVLRVNNVADLFYMTEVLARQPRPRGPRLTILTNAGGPGVLATDALIETGGKLATLSDSTLEQLDKILPAHWSHNNPIDILGDADPHRYTRCVDAAARDENSDGLLVILTPQDMTDPTKTAQALQPYAHLTDRPILASWMGGASVQAGNDILNRAGIPTFAFPDTAVRAFQYMWRYSDNLRALYETPSSLDTSRLQTPLADSIIHDARACGRTILDEAESKRVLAAYGIPTNPTLVATSVDQAVHHAESIGFPVVLKLCSKTITHKADVGGVKLNLGNAQQVRIAFEEIRSSVSTTAGKEHFLGVTVQPMIDTRNAYELIMGSSVDAQFGPILLFGTGGQWVEVFRDRAIGLPPLSTTLAYGLMERTRIFEAMRGKRGRKPVDLEELARLLVRFSQLVTDQNWIKEIDINPLLASSTGVVALDARVILYPPETSVEDMPRPAIRPYPHQYIQSWTASDGAALTLRPIRPDDEPLIVRFHQSLSAQSVQLRYFHAMNLSARIAHDRLIQTCFIDYDRELALVAERRDSISGQNEVVGIASLIKLRGGDDAELSILVADAWQNRGLGSALIGQLLQFARDEQIRHVYADMLAANVPMRHLCQKLGLRIGPIRDGVVRAGIELFSAPPKNH